METILKILFLFCVFSIIGWTLEVLYKFIITRKFSNPGFMTGITLPIYGFGGIVLILLSEFVDKMNSNYEYFILFIACAVVMTLIEYIGGIILLKFYNTRLWDYSTSKYNYKGMVCLSFSIIWGILGLIFYIIFYRQMSGLSLKFLDNKYYIFFFGIFFGVFLVDLFFSLNLLNVVKKYNDYVKETLSLETLKYKMLDDGKRVSIFPNFKLRGYVKERPKN